ncbi:MAG: hypothetical protein Q9181_007472 [Wetmoreana brouardii]
MHISDQILPVPANTANFSQVFWLLLVPFALLAIVLEWLNCTRPWEDYRDDARYVENEVDEGMEEAREDWLLTDNDVDEGAPLPPTRYNTVKEGPLSPDEVERLKGLIIADKEASGTESNAGSRKRKAEGTEQSISPRSRKAKIESPNGMEAHWVSEEALEYDADVQDDEDNAAGCSENCFYPFTFRAAHPNRIINPSIKHRRDPR